MPYLFWYDWYLDWDFLTKCKFILMDDVKFNNLKLNPISISEEGKGTQRRGLKLKNSNLLEGKSVETVYAFPAIE